MAARNPRTQQPDPGARGTSRRALLAGTVTGAAGLALGAGLSPAPRRPPGPDPGHAGGLTVGGNVPGRPSRVRDHPGRGVLRGRRRVAVRRHQHLLPAPAVALHDRQRAQRRGRDVAGGGPGLGVRRRLGRQLHRAAAEAVRVRRRRVRLAGLRHLQGGPARPAAGARAGEQLARLRRHGAVRELVPGPARRLVRRRDQPRHVLQHQVHPGLLPRLREVRADPVQPLYRPALQRRSDDHDLRAGQRAAQPERQDRAAAADLGHRRPARTSSSWPRISWSPRATRAFTATRPTPTTRTPTTRETAGRTSSRCPPSTTARSTCIRRAGGRTRRPSRAPTRSAGGPPGSPTICPTGRHCTSRW